MTEKQPQQLADSAPEHSVNEVIAVRTCSSSRAMSTQNRPSEVRCCTEWPMSMDHRQRETAAQRPPPWAGARTRAFHRTSASSSNACGKAPDGSTAPMRLTADSTCVRRVYGSKRAGWRHGNTHGVLQVLPCRCNHLQQDGGST